MVRERHATSKPGESEGCPPREVGSSDWGRTSWPRPPDLMQRCPVTDPLSDTPPAVGSRIALLARHSNLHAMVGVGQVGVVVVTEIDA